MASKRKTSDGADDSGRAVRKRSVTHKKTGARKKAIPAPMKQWDGTYPDYPNLFEDPDLEDCDAIFEAVRNDETDSTARAVELFHAAMLKRFIERTHAGEAIEPFIAKWLANAFTKALIGAVWDEVLRLPGRELPADWGAIHPIEARDLSLFCDIANRVSAGTRPVQAIESVATASSVSYETARAAYYKWVKRFPDLVSKSEPKE